jgi:phosphoglycolate phosphatase-like HAD superfamily hydrolase
VTFGLRLDEACAREGITVDQYLDAYDAGFAQPFAGVPEMLAALPRWAVCSNKLGRYAREELGALGWTPDVAVFAEAFDGPKRLDPVLDELGLRGDAVLFVGDSEHDRVCAREAGARFALAGWNPRVVPEDGDLLLREPADVLGALL